MKKITSLTNNAKQQLSLTLNDGSRVTIQMNYISAQQGWFYSIAYNPKLLVYNRRLVNSPNLLRAFREIIPFGLACTVLDGYEPVYQDDFTSGRVSLFQLEEDELAQVETLITVTIPNFIGYPLS